MKKMKGELLKVSELSDVQKEKMLCIMDKYYDNVTERIFLNDLSDKEYVIILRDNAENEIRGFSTIKIINCDVVGNPVKAVFSGDTIIEKEYWGETELVKVLGKYFLGLVKECKEEIIYWFLISKGYKTYKYLPLYFKEFYPCYDKMTPLFEKAVIDHLATIKYPHEYNPQKGTIHFKESAECLKKGVADINESKLKNPHINFFVRANPDYFLGDELVCIARLNRDNFREIFYRVVLGKGGYDDEKD